VIMTTRIDVRFEVTLDLPDGEKLCFQNCQYNYPDSQSDIFYRFIRRDNKGNLKAQRGQAGADLTYFKLLQRGMEELLKQPASYFMSRQTWDVNELLANSQAGERFTSREKEIIKAVLDVELSHDIVNPKYQKELLSIMEKVEGGI